MQRLKFVILYGIYLFVAVGFIMAFAELILSSGFALTGASVFETLIKTDDNPYPDKPDEYVKIAVDLANDLTRLKSLRSTLRQKMESSVLMNARDFSANIESVYRTAWREWATQSKV